MEDFINGMGNSLYKMFIAENRWQMILEGVGTTLLIAFTATIIGIILGFIVAVIRSTYEINLKGKKCRKLSDFLMKFLNLVTNVYVTVIRGTPVMVQIIIMFFIIFSSVSNGIIPAILTFGINSGAYVAEIVRGGIMSVDKGQFEASRSLGFNYSSTMALVVLPQAIKSVLPALGNEFIVLLKETSVAVYVSVQELTFTGSLIASRTYDMFTAWFTVAAIYLILVIILSFFLKKFERRLRNSDH